MVLPANTNEAQSAPFDPLEGALSEDFLKFLEAQVQSQVQEERLQARKVASQIWQALQADGSLYSDGLGQKMGSIDQRTYYRWLDVYPGCWHNKAFVNRFLKDNPQYLAPGYYPKVKAQSF